MSMVAATLSWQVALVIALRLVIGVCDDPRDSAPPTASPRSVQGGIRLTEEEVAEHVASAGFPDWAVGAMVCIVNYESGRWTESLNRNGRNGSFDWGLFQINSSNFRFCTGTSERDHAKSILGDPKENAACAFKIAGGASVRHLNRWVAYQSHKEECDRKPNPLWRKRARARSK